MSPLCYNTTYQFSASQISDSGTTELIKFFANSVVNKVGRDYGINVAATYIDTAASTLGVCLTINDNSKSWLILFFNVFQFGIFHTVMILVTRIICMGI